jgi:hypothetical protein
MAPVLAALKACAVQLRVLRLESIGSEAWHVSGAVSTLSQLRSLAITSHGPLIVDKPLTALIALEELTLHSDPRSYVQLTATLPRTITRLMLGIHAGKPVLPTQVGKNAACKLCAQAAAALPPGASNLQTPRATNTLHWPALPTSQVAALTRLQRLTLVDAICRPDGYSALLAITSLTALRVDGMNLGAKARLPGCLHRLTQLQVLYIRARGQQPELARALPSLQQLTALRLRWLAPAVADALAALPRLQTLHCEEDSSGVALPAGAWLAPLRWLRLPGGLLTASITNLEAAQQLELVSAELCDRRGQEQVAELVEWAGQQLSLRWLLLGASSPLLCQAVREHVDAVHDQNHILTIRMGPPGYLYPEMLSPGLASLQPSFF